MTNPFFKFFVLLLPFSLFAHFEDLPQVIDFNSFKGSVVDANYDPTALRLGYAALNYAPELGVVFALLKHDYSIDTVVETGTYRGASTQLFSILFENVHTIEISQNFYQIAKNSFKKSQNVHCHLGSSETVLMELLPKLKDNRLLFYLDAHWNDHWPLLEELEVISKTHQDNCIIVIDDFKVPGRSDILYDHYGPHSCSFEYIKDQMSKIFTDYTVSVKFSHLLLIKFPC